MNAQGATAESKTRKPRARAWLLLFILIVAVGMTWCMWPTEPGPSVFELSRVDGKPRFWATAYSKVERSNPTVLERFYDWITSMQRRSKPNPAAYSLFATPVQTCSLGGLLNQCMEVTGTQYLIAVEAAGGTVDFGHTNTLNGAQWTAAFEQAITNQPVLCIGFPEPGGFKDELVLIRESPDLVKIVPRTKLANYQAAGLLKGDTVPPLGK